MQSLFSLSFWFDKFPVGMSPAFSYGFFVFFALVAITAALLRIASKRSMRDALDKKAFRMAGNAFALMSVLGFFWLFFTYEEVQFFGMRIWFLAIVVILLAQMGKLLYFVRVEAPDMRIKRQSEAQVNQYLPRRNR